MTQPTFPHEYKLVAYGHHETPDGKIALGVVPESVTLDLDSMAAAARQRVAQYVQRAAAQHVRAMRKDWARFRLPDGYHTGDGQPIGPDVYLSPLRGVLVIKKGT